MWTGTEIHISDSSSGTRCDAQIKLTGTVWLFPLWMTTLHRFIHILPPPAHDRLSSDQETQQKLKIFSLQLQIIKILVVSNLEAGRRYGADSLVSLSTSLIKGGLFHPDPHQWASDPCHYDKRWTGWSGEKKLYSIGSIDQIGGPWVCTGAHIH